MTLKLIATTAALFIAASSIAQDKIFQSNGNVIRARVVTVNADNVVYKEWNNDNNTERTLDKNQVDKIKYENGKVEWFSHYQRGNNYGRRMAYRNPPNEGESEAEQTPRNNMAFGTKILSFSPLHVTEKGLGFSVNYERGIDKGGIVSYILPVSAVFDHETHYNGYGSNVGFDNYMFSFSPGLKFYPTSMFGKVKYALGPSIQISSGEQTGNSQPIYSSYYSPVQQNQFMVGAMLVNYLNINPTNHVYMGIDLGFGFTYINYLGGANKNMQGLTQLSFKIGYRF